MYTLRRATPADLPLLLPRTRALQDHESIPISDEALEAALRRLLDDSSLGGAWLIVADEIVGYAIVTFGYDLEFAGRDAYLTELFVDEAARGRGAGSAALALLDPELRALGVRALHLQVRPDNRATHLYERAGFAVIPRWIMSRKM
jgi:ribosomal protein S18 acetylase RimI-like enzyme